MWGVLPFGGFPWGGVELALAASETVTAPVAGAADVIGLALERVPSQFRGETSWLVGDGVSIADVLASRDARRDPEPVVVQVFEAGDVVALALERVPSQFRD